MHKCHYRSRYCHYDAHPCSRLVRWVETCTWLSLYRAIERNGMPRIPDYSSGLDRYRLPGRLATDDESNHVFLSCNRQYPSMKIYQVIRRNQQSMLALRRIKEGRLLADRGIGNERRPVRCFLSSMNLTVDIYNCIRTPR